MTPEVSVIIPVHNEEKYIGRCLRSIFNQTLDRQKYEVIVVNDASTDQTRYALQIFEDDIKVITNEKTMGLPASLNKGIKLAKGRFVVRLDGDDYVSAEYLKLLHLFLSSNQYMDAVACDYLEVDDTESVLARRDCMTAPLGCGIMFRVEHLIDIGLYDENFRLHEDREFRFRFQQKYKINRVEVPLYRYRRHLENMTNDSDRMEEYQKKLVEKHGIEACAGLSL